MKREEAPGVMLSYSAMRLMLVLEVVKASARVLWLLRYIPFNIVQVVLMPRYLVFSSIHSITEKD